MSIKNFGLNPNRSGRPKGAKNRLSWSFLTALAEDFEEFGAETIRICRIERPHEYLRVVAGLMPRELEFTDNTLQSVTDDELALFIEIARRQLVAGASLTGDPGGGAGETTH